MPDVWGHILERFTNDDMDLENENAGNGRLQLWRIYWNSYIDGNFIQQLFGYGRAPEVIKSILSIFGKSYSPHNAFMGMLYWNGVLGILFYLKFIYENYRVGIKMLQKKYEYGATFIVTVLLLFFTSFFTVHFEGNYPILLNMFILGGLYGHFQSKFDKNHTK